MRIKKEEELLDENIRRQIIDEINGSENQERKDEAFKRYMCFKDKTVRYVVEQLIRQFEQSTVEEMSYALGNISVTKKVINKLARVYNNGVKRTARNKDGITIEEDTKKVEEFSKLIELNTQMKKGNKYLKLQRNMAVQICPVPTETPAGEKYKIAVKILQPYLYDVVENWYQREEPMCFILSSYKTKSAMKSSLEPAKEGRGLNTIQLKPLGNGKDEKIADTPSDQDAEKQEYIWWSNSYHFTTNGKGQLISQGQTGIDNPIREMPFVNFAIEQDGSFWAQGGEDITDGAVLINSLITNVNHIGVIQGYGQFWMKGENIPTFVKLGPTRVVRMEYTKDSVEPDLGFATANAPLNELKAQIEMYLALLLTTNNLSTSGISAQLTGGKDFASGIALILDKAESTEDVEEQEQIFHDKEPLIWRKCQKWQEVYNAQGLLDEPFREQMLPPDLKVGLKFGDPQPIMTETEKLTNLEKRKELALNTEVEILMMDDSNLTEEQALEKLKRITLERAKKMAEAIIKGEDDQDNGVDGQREEDDSKDRSRPNGAAPVA
jgi:hypothetical protein